MRESNLLYPESKQAFRSFGWVKSGQTLLAVMVVLQLMWFAGIWVTGATRLEQVPVLAVYSILSGFLILSLSKNTRQLVAWRNVIRHHPRRVLLGLCLVILSVGILYAFYQRVWPYDEEGAFAAAQLIAQQGVNVFFRNYADLSWLGKHHPPLIILLHGFLFSVFGVHLLLMRLVTLVFLIGTVLVTYQLGATLYDEETGLFAAFSLASFPLVMRLGTTGMLDVPVTFFLVLAIYLVVRMEERQSYGFAAAAGVVLGMGLLTKYSIVLIYPVILGYLLVRRSFVRSFWRFAILCAISGVFLLVWVTFLVSSGFFAEQSAIVKTYVGAVANSARTDSHWALRALFETLATRLPSSLGVYTIPALVLGGLALWRERTTETARLLLLWIGLISLVLIVTLPDHRYFMATFPALAIIEGRALIRLQTAGVAVVALTLLLWGGSLYLFVDWSRTAMLFLPN